MGRDFPNLNALWADVLVETLRCKGIRYAVTCPGSRSSPLTFAFARNGSIEAIPVLDERSAGFFALGLAKRSGRPVAVVCTSGSAVANLFPAVVEASESGVSLILLTADRPPELRQCAAGQTIDQIGFFGGYVRYFADVACPENDTFLLRYLRQTVAFAVERSVTPDMGPVHLNLPLRDPLAPIEVDSFKPCLRATEKDAFLSGLHPPVRARYAEMSGLGEHLAGERGLLVVGPNSPIDKESWIANLARFANALQWPVLADSLSPIRSRASDFQTLVCSYEFILRSPRLRSELLPDRIVVIDELPTCKVLRDWLSQLDLPMHIIARRPRNADPTRSKTRTTVWNLETDGVPMPEPRAPGAYCGRWLQLDTKCSGLLEGRMERERGLFEGKIAWVLGRALPDNSVLCVSNSMPPRDLDFYFGPSGKSLSIYSSRGANGIDGILSTAIGVAHAGQPTYLVIGDLALLHDTNGALLSRVFEGSLTLILVDNAGGGIFEMLPISGFEPEFSKHFATDQQVSIADWAGAYGIAFEQINDWPTFEARLRKPEGGIRILSVVTDRKKDAQRRKDWFAQIATALEETS